MIDKTEKLLFNRIGEAFKEKRAGLIECTRKDTKEPAFLIADFNVKPDGSVEVIPRAELLLGDSITRYTPPEGLNLNDV